MQNRLQFVINNSGAVKNIGAYIIIETVEGLSYVNIDHDLGKFLDYSIEYSKKNNILFNKMEIKDNNTNINIVNFDRGIEILRSFNKYLDKTVMISKLKKIAVRGMIISKIGTLGITSSILINNIREKEDTNNVVIEKNTDYDFDINKGVSSILATNMSLSIDTENMDNELKIMLDDDISTKKESNDTKYDDFSNVILFNYEDRSDSINIKNARRYDNLFVSLSDIYGSDKNILEAIAAQENKGEHTTDTDTAALGIMQIEKAIVGKGEIVAYNFKENRNEKIVVDEEKVLNLDYNCKVGAMLFQYNLNYFDNDFEKALQAYNMGCGNVEKLVNTYGDDWKDYRSTLGVGDPLYIEHVLSYLPDGTNINFKTPSGEDLNYTIKNASLIEKENTTTLSASL